MVVTRLMALGDPCAAAAEVGRKTLEVILKSNPAVDPSRRLVEDVCRGAMVGLLLSEQNLPKGATLLVAMVLDVGHEFGLDPREVMVSALEGIARMSRFVTAEEMQRIRKAITLEFVEADALFGAILTGRQIKPDEKII